MRRALLVLVGLGTLGCGRWDYDAINGAALDGSTGDGGIGPQGPLAQETYLKASNTAPTQLFSIVALSANGSTLAVGAPNEAGAATGINGNQADTSASGAGAVYVYRWSGSSWLQEAYVKASNTDAGDRFGTAVAISADGSTLAVGAHWEDSNATGINGDDTDDSAIFTGAAYVFRRTGADWSQEAYVKASNTGAIDYYGSSITLSADGSTLAVGAASESSSATGINGDETDNSVGGAGAVYVYTRSGTMWNQQAYVKASNTELGDSFGAAVALSGDGDTLAVGAKGEASAAAGIDGNQADNTLGNAGAVYVFTRDSGTWSQQAYVKASTPGRIDEFGSKVALSNNGATMVVAAKNEDGSATGVGGDQNNDDSLEAGAAYLFVRNGATWNQEAYVKAPNTAANDGFATDIALSADGSTLAVGADGEDSAASGIDGVQTDDALGNSGAVYVYTRATDWTFDTYVKASNPGANDRFGTWLGLSANGSRLAVGAPAESSATSGVDGDQLDDSAMSAGAVYVFAR